MFFFYVNVGIHIMCENIYTYMCIRWFFNKKNINKCVDIYALE